MRVMLEKDSNERLALIIVEKNKSLCTKRKIHCKQIIISGMCFAIIQIVNVNDNSASP